MALARCRRGTRTIATVGLRDPVTSSPACRLDAVPRTGRNRRVREKQDSENAAFPGGRQTAPAGRTQGCVRCHAYPGTGLATVCGADVLPRAGPAARFARRE
jgi:hypothetical protein